MQNKTIFNNYQSKCPNCGGDLDSEHRFCPYCGQNLEKLNIQYRDNEEIISDAIEGIDDAKRRLEQRESQYKSSQKETIGSKILKWILILAGIQLAIVIIAGVIFAIYDSSFNSKVQNLKTTLNEQKVNVVEIEPVNVDAAEFFNTDKQSASGYIQESEDVLKIPFFADGYGNQGVFKGHVYVSKDGLEEIDRFDTNSVYLTYENFSVTIYFTNASYNEKPLDLIYIYNTEELKATERLSNVQVGDAVFEQYLVDDTYYAIASPYSGCFIECSSYLGYGLKDVAIEDLFKIVRVDTAFELK